ncbi:beta-galactosidase [Enterococcus sp. AZ194]|uniref:beta-galactosidase n=1 Tax=Enterococcus sp. AZ194 TaxID=2774629 RepID=UPI003F1EDFBB
MTKYFERILYGGDYNPEQWPQDVWQEDMRIFKNAAINSATINVFAWSKLQPSENEYDFSELDAIVAMLEKEHYDIILATSTAAIPAWLFKKYPEVARTTYEGLHNKFASRHNFCPNSLIYQKYAKALTEKIVARYASNKHVKCWHINNEYNGICYCDNCEKAFRVWLKEKYQILDALNEAWYMDFWSHRIYDWDEIVVPNARAEGVHKTNPYFAGISLDYQRFNSDSLLNLFKMERDIVRASGSKAPITTNLMGTYKGLDYFKWAKEMDIVSWDSYPAYDTPWYEVAMSHDLMRGLKDQSFMLMEQTPSQQNYQQYNALKRPGQLRAQSYQTLAHGADSILYFQLRRSKGAAEKFHGAVIEHGGRDNTRVLREVSQIGQELRELGDGFVGASIQAEAGILFDWESYWGLEYTSGPTKDLYYVPQIKYYYKQFYERNVPVNFISTETDFSRYKVVVAPVFYMVKEGMKEKLEAYVKAGGILVTTFMSGLVDQSDNVHLGGYPGPLKDLAGIWVEEIDALAKDTQNQLQFSDGTKSSGRLLCDLIHLEGAESLADYTTDFYQGMPAITRNQFGKGSVYYLGTQLEEGGLGKVLQLIFDEVAIEPIIKEPSALEITKRVINEDAYFFLLNFTEEKVAVPKEFIGLTDLISNQPISSESKLAKYEVMIVKK